MRAPTDTGRVVDGRIDGVVVGLESRYCALAADDPLARRRQLRLADLADRVVAVDPRTGTTTPDLWPPGGRPRFEEIHDVDDWLAVIATGRCVGVTAESTTSQYGRRGIVFRRLRDAPPVPVRLIWWRDDSHPATRDVVGLLAELYRREPIRAPPARLDSSQSAPFIRVCRECLITHLPQVLLSNGRASCPGIA